MKNNNNNNNNNNNSNSNEMKELLSKSAAVNCVKCRVKHQAFL
jgi:hypothetical protein